MSKKERKLFSHSWSSLLFPNSSPSLFPISASQREKWAVKNNELSIFKKSQPLKPVISYSWPTGNLFLLCLRLQSPFPTTIRSWRALWNYKQENRDPILQPKSLLFMFPEKIVFNNKYKYLLSWHRQNNNNFEVQRKERRKTLGTISTWYNIQLLTDMS